MNRMKSTLSLILIFALSLSLPLTGCNREAKDEGKQQESTVEKASEQSTAAEASTQEETKTEGQRSNFFGIHTMVGDTDSIEQHLDWAHNLVGDGGYVKQFFYGISKNTKGPSTNWINFLKECYKRNLIPIIRVAGTYQVDHWLKPEATAPGDYSELAAAIKRVFEKLPMKKGVPLYVEVYNEPNLTIEWGGETPQPTEYGKLLVAVSKALKSIGDLRIKVLNGALSPGGNYNNVQFVEDMIKTVPESLYAFDYWASHPYPANHAPEYNNHDKTAKYRDFTIDSYVLELEVLEKYGRKDTKVVITETGYELGNQLYNFEGKPTITDELRTDYITRAFRDYWSKWPEIIAVCPFEMVAVNRGWERFDWIQIDSESDEKGFPTKYYPQYKAVAELPELPYIADASLEATEDKNMEDVTANSANLALKASVTVSTSIEDYGWTVNKLNNGYTTDSDLGWTSEGDEEDEWIILEFPEEKEIGRVVMVPRSDGAEAGKYFPQAFTIQVSGNGKDWTDVFEQKKAGNEVFNPGVEPQTYTFNAVKAKFLKIHITGKTNHGSGGFHAQLSELEVY